MVFLFSLPDLLVLAAAGSYFLGYLFINQVILRLLVLFGTALYIAYYATVADTPLWIAIWTSVALGCANLFGLGLLLAWRSRLAVPKEAAQIFSESAVFGDLPPGDFRVVYNAAQRLVVDKDTILSTEGQQNETMYYLVDGSVKASKLGHEFDMPSDIFIGEVAYMLRRPSAATITARAGSELLAWDYKTLEARSQKSARFKLAIDAMMSRDLARKVAAAVAPSPKA